MNPKKILIIDKDHDSLNLLLSRLEARGYSVITCDSSLGAVRLVNEDMPDLILLDAQMEQIWGDELPRVIKKNIHNFFVPIIMMTAREQIAEQIMGMHRGFDDIILKPFNPLELQLRIEMNLKRAQETVQANPLTKLPGNIAIEHTIKGKITSGEKFSVCYIDIDNFKSFNDKYGFDKGDDVIVQTSRILFHAAQTFGDGDIFVGHIGGDDFVVILKPEYEEVFATKCIEEFDRLMPTHYSKEDQKAGKIFIKNRRGEEEQYPLMSISIAAVTNLNRTFTNTGEIAQTATEVKKFLKTQSGSNYLRDRREQQVESFHEADKIFQIGKEKKETSEPLGQILLRAGLITEEQLNEALKKHFATGQRLGRVLIQMKAISSEKVGQMLERKLGVPYISLSKITLPHKLQRLFTAEYIKLHGVVPFKVEKDQLYLAMIDPFDLNTIDDIERITSYKAFPCIALEEEFAEFIEKYFSDES